MLLYVYLRMVSFRVKVWVTCIVLLSNGIFRFQSRRRLYKLEETYGEDARATKEDQAVTAWYHVFQTLANIWVFQKLIQSTCLSVNKRLYK